MIIQLSIPPNESKTLTTISSILYNLRSYLFFPSPERFILLYPWVLCSHIITTEYAACYRQCMWFQYTVVLPHLVHFQH